MLSPKSCFTISHILSVQSRFVKGIRIKSSITADKKKQTMQSHKTGMSPYILYRIPPRTGPRSEEKELIMLTTELAARKFSRLTRTGMLACTEG